MVTIPSRIISAINLCPSFLDFGDFLAFSPSEEFLAVFRGGCFPFFSKGFGKGWPVLVLGCVFSLLFAKKNKEKGRTGIYVQDGTHRAPPIV